MNDVLARAACDLEDDPLCRQDITKDIDNEIAIAQRCRSMLAGVVHHPHVSPELRPQNSRSRKRRRNRRMRARRHLYVTSYAEGFSHFVTSMTAPVASGWSVRRVGLALTGKRRLSRRTPFADRAGQPRERAENTGKRA
jgi:hypothetical protein